MSIHFTLILALFMSISRLTGQVLITLYALKLGAQPFTVGILAAMVSMMPTLLSWRVGRLADRFGARWLLMVSAAAGALGMLVSYVKPGLPSLFVTSLMYGLLSALSGAPLQNLVGLLSRPQDRAKNFSNFSVVVSSTSFVGPLLAGFSIDHAGPGAACLTWFCCRWCRSRCSLSGAASCPAARARPPMRKRAGDALGIRALAGVWRPAAW